MKFSAQRAMQLIRESTRLLDRNDGTRTMRVRLRKTDVYSKVDSGLMLGPRCLQRHDNFPVFDVHGLELDAFELFADVSDFFGKCIWIPRGDLDILQPCDWVDVVVGARFAVHSDLWHSALARHPAFDLWHGHFAHPNSCTVAFAKGHELLLARQALATRRWLDWRPGIAGHISERAILGASPCEIEIVRFRYALFVANTFQGFLFDTMQSQLTIRAPRDKLKLSVVYATLNGTSCSPEKLLHLSMVTRKSSYGLDVPILVMIIDRPPVIQIQIPVTMLRHSHQTPTERGMPGSPDRKGRLNHPVGLVQRIITIPELDCPIQSTSNDLIMMKSVPVHTIDLGVVRLDCPHGDRAVTTVPNMQELVMRTRHHMLVLSRPLDLRRRSEPVGEAESRPPRRPQIPAMHETVHGARCENVWVVRREVDVCDGTPVAVKDKLNVILPGLGVEVPYQGFLIRGADHPVVTRGEGRPLDIGDFPWRTVWEVAWRRVWWIEVHNV
jgi:hypothetical protein